jgi:hypothetical protein
MHCIGLNLYRLDPSRKYLYFQIPPMAHWTGTFERAADHFQFQLQVTAPLCTGDIWPGLCCMNSSALRLITEVGHFCDAAMTRGSSCTFSDLHVRNWLV